ncbi:MAG: acetyltransferase [Bacteroidota bacterium]|nr:acetyltransferase [Bacteroidota bacterium]
MQELLIFPYSGTAIETLDCLSDHWDCIGFISDDENMIGKEQFNIKVYGRRALEDFPNAKILAVHGSPSSFHNRGVILVSLKIPYERYAMVIHKNASVSTRATIGRNVLIMAGVVITANAIIRDHVIILPNSVIHHDSIVGERTLIAANATIAGNVQIGSNCYIGAASSIKNGLSLGNNVLVGMGANVISSFPDDCTVIGNPAKTMN